MKKISRISCLLLALINSLQITVAGENLIQKNYAVMPQEQLDQNLISAIKNNHVNTVKELIQAGADIDQKITYTIGHDELDTLSTLLDYAKYKGYEDIAKELIQARTNENVSTAIVAASQAGDLDAVKKLMRAGVNLRYAKQCCLALMVASQEGYLEIAKELIRGGVDVNYEFNGFDSTALLAASSCGHLDIMRALIKAGANVDAVNSFGSTCLIQVIDHYHSKKNIDFVTLLLNAKANVNYKSKYGETALEKAVRSNQSIVVNKLIQAGADIDQKIKDGLPCSLLSFAIRKCNNEVLKELKKSKEILFVASKEENLKLVEELVQEGFDVNITDGDGNTALMKLLCTWYRDYYYTDEIIRTLLKAKCNVNHVNIYGNTALIEAVVQGRYKAVEILLDHPDIKVNHVNNDKKTALEVAIEKAPSDHLDYFDHNESLEREAIAKLLKKISQ